MKSAAFAYHAPNSIDEAIALLDRYGDDGKLLAGGQSLVPAMAFRLARPAVLIDINRIPGLDGIAETDGQLRIGALTRHARFEQPVTTGPLGRLLPRVAACIAHTPIRSRGTFGGSLAHADPAAEWCALALALDAQIVATGPQGERAIPASGFFTTIFTTALYPNELLTQIRLPHLDSTWRCGFAEFSRRAGDFALAMAVVAVRLEQGVIRQARIALGGVASTPVLAPAAMQILTGAAPTDAVLKQAGEAASAGVRPDGDIHGSAEYRRDLAGTMVYRALKDALAA
jgi:carbon-monoxide dehydrogenase medium subunit